MVLTTIPVQTFMSALIKNILLRKFTAFRTEGLRLHGDLGYV